MFDFQMDIFETIMTRFRNKMEVIIRGDFDLELKEEEGVYSARFQIRENGDSCFLYWAPMRYMVLDLYPALKLCDYVAESLRACEDVADLAAQAGRDYALHSVALVVGPNVRDKVNSLLRSEGFCLDTTRNDVYVTLPVPTYLKYFMGPVVPRMPEPVSLEEEAIKAVRRLPRFVTDVDIHRESGGVKHMSLQ